ncbi:hypothetical protein REC12_19035, partial [Desulfosporosinus sp. PR]
VLHEALEVFLILVCQVFHQGLRSGTFGVNYSPYPLKSLLVLQLPYMNCRNERGKARDLS